MMVRVDARTGYDLWSATYDETPNPVVAMDARHSVRLLAPQPGERILDAGCGTGRNLARLDAAGALAVGLDFSPGMASVARRRTPGAPVLLADLHQPLPLASARFDALLCALIGEHLNDLSVAFSEFHRVLKPEGRLVFTVYHPDLAAAGKEANFQQEGIEYRLGAVRHTVADYRDRLAAEGFTRSELFEFTGDAALAAQVPGAQNLLDLKVLLAVRAYAATSK